MWDLYKLLEIILDENKLHTAYIVLSIIDTKSFANLAQALSSPSKTNFYKYFHPSKV